MGSFLGQTYIAEHGDKLAAAVLSGTSGPPPGILPLGKRIVAFERWRLGPRGKSPLVQALLFGEQNKPFRPARTPYDWLSRDAAEVDKYVADPLCGFPLTNQLAADLVGALANLASPTLAARIPKALPIYVFSGARDPVGAKLQGLLDVYRAAGLDVTAKLYPDARHETLNETNRDEVTRDLLDLDRRPPLITPQGRGKIRQVVVPCASKRPRASTRRPSAVAIWRPALSTRPSARTSPVASDNGRTKFTFSSTLV